jgi:hypothetical protein
MEPWVWVLVLGVPLVVVYRYFYFRAGRIKRNGQLESVLSEKLGVSNLNDAAIKLLQPALEAHKSRRFSEETRIFEEVEAQLHTIVLDTRLGNDSDGKTDFSFNLQTKWALSRAITQLGLFQVEGQISELSKPLRQMSFEERFALNSMSEAELDELKFGVGWVKCGVSLHNLSSTTKVKVYSDGQKHINYTSRASLGSAAVGAVLPGPAVIYALARPKVVRHEDDDRELSIVVWDKDWEIDVDLDPDLKKEAKKFAEALQKQILKVGGTVSLSASRSRQTKPKAEKGKGPSTSGPGLAKLVELLDKGLITETEFKQLKGDKEE